MKKRSLGAVAGVATTLAVGLVAGPGLPAWGHEVPPPSDPSPTKVAGNTGNGTYYLLNEVQHGHLEAPLLGFGPALEDPIGYGSGHVAPVGIETAERIGGISQSNEHEHGGTSTPPPSDPSPLKASGNVGNGSSYLLSEVQHGHLGAPILGLGPALADPIGYVGSHVAPVTIETVERIGGISQSDVHDHGGEEEPDEPDDGHEH